jgi:hypothetical protein
MTNLSEEKYKEEQHLLDNYYSFEYATKSTIEIANEFVAGHLLSNLYKTIGLQSQLDPTKFYFELILEIDGKDKFRFTDAYLVKLAENEKFEPITEQEINLESGAIFKNVLIKEIWKSQYGEWALELENGIIIESRDQNGTNIFIGKNYC